ncbi:MAG: hypothetical protein H6718_35895 [Polyangiaceae bacterium]|nr:hypothetical protein [Myxococcales bacterium]MCB9590843.1 hypothetical protein [Polyangiaceae bacterium]
MPKPHSESRARRTLVLTRVTRHPALSILAGACLATVPLLVACGSDSSSGANGGASAGGAGGGSQTAGAGGSGANAAGGTSSGGAGTGGSAGTNTGGSGGTGAGSSVPSIEEVWTTDSCPAGSLPPGTGVGPGSDLHKVDAVQLHRDDRGPVAPLCASPATCRV